MNEVTSEYYQNLIVEPAAESKWNAAAQSAWQAAANGSDKRHQSKAAREALVAELHADELDPEGLLTDGNDIQWDAVADALLASSVEGYVEL